jgi:putative protease
VLVTSDLIAAKTPQAENIIRQLSKLGETPYAIQNIDIDKDITNLFIPSSLLANSKRLVIEQLLSGIDPNALCQPTTFNIQANPKNAGSGLSYTANVSNSKAKAVYQKLGYAHIDPAYEIEPQSKDSAIMFCKYCIKRQINLCSKTAPKPNGTSFKEPFYLKSVDGRKFKLSFDCKNCIMKVYPTS